MPLCGIIRLMEIKLVTGLTAFEAAKNTIRQIDPLQQDVINLAVVPDAFSMQAEALIFDVLGITSTFNIQVVGISRLASKILRQNGIAFNRISALEEVFAVYCAVRECEKQSKLAYFKKCGVDLCQKILQIIKQFKACRVRPEQIKPVGDENLDAKMADLRLIYEKYEALLGEKLDLSRLLEFFVDEAENALNLKNFNLYFVNFDSFSVEINNFICRLAKFVGSVCIGYAKPATAQKNAYIYEDDIFKKTTALAKENGVNVAVENFQTQLSGANLLIAKNLFALNLSKQTQQLQKPEQSQKTQQTQENELKLQENPQNLQEKLPKTQQKASKLQENVQENSQSELEENGDSFFVNVLAKNRQDEVDFVAKYIKKRVVDCEKFSNFAVAVADKKYFDLLKNKLQEYGIAAYTDDAVSLDQTILGRFLLKCLDIAKLGFSQQDFQFLASNPLLNADGADGADGADQNTLSEIAYFLVDDKDEFLQRFEKYSPIVFAIDALSKCHTCQNFSLALQKIMEIVRENHEKMLKNLENPRFFKKLSENQQSFPLVLGVLEKLAALGENEQFSIFDFENLLQMSFQSVKVETVPTYVDAVFVGDATTSYFADVNTLFVLGATADALPKSQADTGLIDDQEIKKLRLSFALEPEIRVLNRRSRLKLFELLQHAKQKLVVLQPLSQDGRMAQRASFVDDLQILFSTKPMRTDTLEEFGVAMFSREEELENLLFCIGSRQNLMPFYTKMHGSLPPDFESSVRGAISKQLPHLERKEYLSSAKNSDSVKKLEGAENFENSENSGDAELCKQKDIDCVHGETKSEILPQKNTISPSELETYFSCPNKRFFAYELRLKECENILPTRKQFGTFEHALLQNLAEQFGSEMAKISDAQLQQFLAKNFDTLAQQIYDPKVLQNRYFKKYLKNESMIILKNAVMEQKFSSFRPFKLEEQISEKILDKTLYGKADRIDKFGQFFRVIDYKTGKVSGVKNALYHGRRLQLFLYAHAIAARTGLTCTGVYYFDCQTAYAKNGAGHKLFNGLTLKDNEIVLASDSRLDEVGAKSNILGTSRVKKPKDNFLFSVSGMEENLQKQINYATKISEMAIQEIEQGYIAAKPCTGGCNYCAYLSICRHTNAEGFRKNLKGTEEE